MAWYEFIGWENNTILKNIVKAFLIVAINATNFGPKVWTK